MDLAMASIFTFLTTPLDTNDMRKVDKMLLLGPARTYFLGEYWSSNLHACTCANKAVHNV